MVLKWRKQEYSLDMKGDLFEKENHNELSLEHTDVLKVGTTFLTFITEHPDLMKHTGKSNRNQILCQTPKSAGSYGACLPRA